MYRIKIVFPSWLAKRVHIIAMMPLGEARTRTMAGNKRHVGVHHRPQILFGQGRRRRRRRRRLISLIRGGRRHLDDMSKMSEGKTNSKSGRTGVIV